jgi:uncharacterized protein YdcH (DUF465 family)
MSDQEHSLVEEFPADKDILHRLKLEDQHYAKVAARYHELNKEIHRIEAEIEAASDTRIEELKKERLSLLDDVAAMVAKAKAQA